MRRLRALAKEDEAASERTGEHVVDEDPILQRDARASGIRVVNPSPPSSPHPSQESTLRTLRRILLATFVVSIVGTASELLLVGHVEDVWQLVPLALFGLSLAVLAWERLGGGAASIRAHQTLMVLYVASGLVGLALHYKANVEFELEMYPDLGGFALFWKAIQGASPPSLAPGAMVALGLLGLAYAYHHPALAPSSVPATNTTGVTS